MTTVVRYRAAKLAPAKAALYDGSGRKWGKIVMMEDGPLRVRKVLKSEERYMTPLLHKDAPYPVRRAVRLMRRHGRAFGVTKEARRFLADIVAR